MLTEIAHLWNKPIKERLSINIKLFRNLRAGLEIEDAVKINKNNG